MCRNLRDVPFPCHSHFEVRLCLQNTIKSTKFFHITCKSLSAKQNIILTLTTKMTIFSSSRSIEYTASFFFSYKKRLNRVKEKGSAIAIKFQLFSQLRINNTTASIKPTQKYNPTEERTEKQPCQQYLLTVKKWNMCIPMNQLSFVQTHAFKRWQSISLIPL